MIENSKKDYSDRVIEAFKLAGCTIEEVNEKLGIQLASFKRAIKRGSINSNHLAVIEKEFGVSKEYIVNGVEPILIIRQTIIWEKFIENDSVALLEELGIKKLIAYIILKEDEFLKDKDFVMLLTKLKATIELRKIANED